MVKGSEVQIVTLSFVLLPLIYRLGVLQSVLGTFWLPLKEAGRKALQTRQTFPVCQIIFSPPPLSQALLTSVRHKHLAINAFPCATSFFSLNHYWWQTHYGVSTGLAASDEPGLYQNLHFRVFFLDWIRCYAHFLSLATWEAAKKGFSRSQRWMRAGSGVISEWDKASPSANQLKPITECARHQQEGMNKNLAMTSPDSLSNDDCHLSFPLSAFSVPNVMEER